MLFRSLLVRDTVAAAAVGQDEVELLQSGGRVVQETRSFDAATGTTSVVASREVASAADDTGSMRPGSASGPNSPPDTIKAAVVIGGDGTLRGVAQRLFRSTPAAARAQQPAPTESGTPATRGVSSSPNISCSFTARTGCSGSV